MTKSIRGAARKLIYDTALGKTTRASSWELYWRVWEAIRAPVRRNVDLVITAAVLNRAREQLNG